ncbi:MAG TPA: transposase [Nitrososphaera sp.]
MPTAIKSVKQSFVSSPELLEMMETFKRMVNDCIRIGLRNDASTMKRLSKLSYSQLARYNIVSYYKLHAISKAAGILANRKQSIKRGYQTKTPYLKKGILVSCYGFKIADQILRVPIGNRQYFDIPLNRYANKILFDSVVRVRSFTLTASSTVSICYSKEVGEVECDTISGADRNLANLTVGNERGGVQYNLSQSVDIVENTRSIVRSFKRNDVRIRKKIAGKYGQRRQNRINQLLHHVSKQVVAKAKQEKTAIAFEKLTCIRRLYEKGNHHGRNYRSRLNGWSFAEIKRQIEYKAQWEGVPVIQLSVTQTRGTSKVCPQCGKRIQEAHYKDVIHERQLWCSKCLKWMDRDVVAAMNIARKGGEVFHRSKGDASEAMKGNPTTPVILRVDASKLARGLSLKLTEPALAK